MASRIAWPVVRSVISAGLPNILLLMVIGANMMWWSRLLPIHYLDVPYFSPGDVWMEVVLTVGTVMAVDIAAVFLFARGWRARRWGRKPDEIERSARYIGIS